MKEVERESLVQPGIGLNKYGVMKRDPQGGFVRFSDYDALRADLAACRAKLTEAEQTLTAANARVAKLEEALGSLIRTCKTVMGLNGGYRQLSGVLRSAVERAATAAAKEGGDA